MYSVPALVFGARHVVSVEVNMDDHGLSIRCDLTQVYGNHVDDESQGNGGVGFWYAAGRLHFEGGRGRERNCGCVDLKSRFVKGAFLWRCLRSPDGKTASMCLKASWRAQPFKNTWPVSSEFGNFVETETLDGIVRVFRRNEARWARMML